MKRKRNATGRMGPARKRRRTDTGTPSTAAVDRAVQILNRRTAGFMGRELKYKDYTKAVAAIGTTLAGAEIDPATIESISSIDQGDGPSQRDGREYFIHSVHLRGIALNRGDEEETAPTADSIVRIALVWDTQTNGAQLNAEDVFDDSATLDALAFRNLENSKRFIVLKDKWIRLPVAQAVTNYAMDKFGNGQVQVAWKMNKRFKTPIKVRCLDNGANVSSVSDNSLHVIALAIAPTASQSNVEVGYEARIRFTG